MRPGVIHIIMLGKRSTSNKEKMTTTTIMISNPLEWQPADKAK
jgi:hypothetical protein